MRTRVFLDSCAIAVVALLAAQVDAGPVISVGTSTTTVPTYIANSPPYPFPTSVSPLSPGEFLLPVDISGAANLQTWQFDLMFNSTVVSVVDPGDGSSGTYGAEFTPGDPNSLSNILASGFLFTGDLAGVAGAYPSLLTGPSGDGVLAFVVFQFLPGQSNNDPGFGIANGSTQQGVPEPGTLALLAGGLALLGNRRLLRRN
jgi:hypothetical protein